MAAEDGAGNASGKRGAISRTGGRQGGATGMVQDQWSFYGTVGGAYVPRYSGSDESVAVPVFGFGVRSPTAFS